MTLMTPQSQKILEEMQVRKTMKQKEDFWLWLCEELKQAGYDPRVEQGKYNCRNIVAGDPEKAELFFTAH